MSKIYSFTIVDKVKLAELEKLYAKAFQGRLVARQVKEREAEIKYRDYVITY